MHYCDVSNGEGGLHQQHHDEEYGLPVTEEHRLFERLSLEIFQAGLSWDLMLKRRPAFNAAFDNFYPDKVAGYDETRLVELVKDARVIRNRLKLSSIIHNARVIRSLPQGSFHALLQEHHPLPLKDWITLFRKTFKFMGPTIVQEFLMSTGYISGAHKPDCPYYEKMFAAKAPWTLVDYKRFNDWP